MELFHSRGMSCPSIFVMAQHQMHADIRPARVSDIDALISIEKTVFKTDRLSRRSFRRHIQSDTAVMLVADNGAATVGYSLVLHRRHGRAARLYSIAVASAFASAGIGSVLLAAAEEAARAAGCRRLRLEVREENRRAIALYERAGYRPIGRKENYYEDGIAALQFEKTLTERGGQ